MDELLFDGFDREREGNRVLPILCNKNPLNYFQGHEAHRDRYLAAASPLFLKTIFQKYIWFHY